ncbi:unnamed protein product [Meloidogyne enterolobii]|uniref:Uncharacterized protein n=1 Tax=Meloidogyne enterolobii TaxID=390850 RepID=A0ACB0YNI9_MELEN
MGQDLEPSFKDVKLLNRLYCTRNYPHTSTLSKSINSWCDIKNYELNNGKCRNGGYPDPLKNCKCLCPEGYDGDDCTEYKYGNNGFMEKTAKGYERLIWSVELLRNLGDHLLIPTLFVIKVLNKTDDRIKAKRIILQIREMTGYKCRRTCKGDDYIEIKYLKDKSATGFA